MKEMLIRPEDDEKNKIKAFITNDGELIKVNKTDEVIQKEASEGASGGTARLNQDLWGELYKSGKCARPPYNPTDLIELLETNTFHYKCIKQKALDTTASYSIVETEDDKDVDIENRKKNKKKKVDDSGRRQMIDFLKKCNPVLSFNQIVKAMMMDLDSIGWCVMEVIRNRGGQITGFNHIPAYTTRYLLDNKGLVHKRDARERLFKFFGDEEVIVDPNTDFDCNEVIYIFDYSPRSDYYGIPDYIPAVGAMLANLKIRDYNIAFFENGAVPQYAVILEGGDLDEGTEEIIKSHFRDNIKGSSNAHKTLVISTPEGGKIEFKPLAVDVKDGHFRMYRTDNRDEIIQAHGVPPYRIGIAESGALGGNVAEEMTKIYKTSTILPRQIMLADQLNRIFADPGFFGGITSWKLEFDELDIDDDKAEADIQKTKADTANVMKQSGVYTPDEIKEKVGDIPYNEMDDSTDEIKEWASTPTGYIAPAPEPEPGDPNDPNADPNAQGVDADGNPLPIDPNADQSDQGASDNDPYQSILDDYRNNQNNDVQKSWVQKVLKSFQVEGERVWISKTKNIVQILKSKIGIKGKPKKVADSETEIEDKLNDKLKDMFSGFEDKIIEMLPELDLSIFESVEIQKDDIDPEKFQEMISSQGFQEQFPEIYKMFLGVMEPSQLATILYELMVMGIEFGLSDALSEVKGLEKNISFNLYDKRVSKFLDEYVFKASDKTMSRLIGDVLGQIKLGKEAGESIPTIQKRLKDCFENMKYYEAERIARTEVIKACNAGRFNAYKEGGVPRKMWIGFNDGRERDSHIACNYEIVDIDKPFSNGLMYPGDPDGEAKEVINCRCTIGAIYPENEQEWTEKYNEAHKDDNSISGEA